MTINGRFGENRLTFYDKRTTNGKKIENESSLTSLRPNARRFGRQSSPEWQTVVSLLSGSVLPMPISWVLVVSRRLPATGRRRLVGRGSRSAINYLIRFNRSNASNTYNTCVIYYNPKHLFPVIYSNHFSTAFQRSVYADLVSLFARIPSTQDISHKSVILLVRF